MKTGKCCMCEEQGAVPYELGADDKTGKLYCLKHTRELAEWLDDNAAIQATYEETYLKYDCMVVDDVNVDEAKT